MIRYLIIDDEPIAHEIIEEYSGHFTQLHLKKNCYNVFQAAEYLNNHDVDLIFLDINMPRISGFEFLKSLVNPPKIIVTTAYKEYALEGYELDIVDYLLKPFGLQRFLKAVNKITSPSSEKITDYDKSSIEDKLILKDGKRLHQVFLNDILYIEAYGNYTKVVLKTKTVITLEKLSSYIQKLPNKEFVQVHKSFIVAISKIETIENNKIVILDTKIPIGQTYKKNLTGFFT